MFCKITIPRISDHYKLYVYSSTNGNDINTISKIKAIQPTYVIDEAIADYEIVNGRESYVFDDIPNSTYPNGITYVGPSPNCVPLTEYESSIYVSKVNDYTYVNQLALIPLNTNYIGTIVYYSVIGVDETNGLVTHLSKLNQVLINSEYKETGTRHLYSCNNLQEDTWEYISSVPWSEEIMIGNINDPIALSKYGIPIVETVPQIDKEKINFDTRPLLSNGFCVLEIQNPWQKNNTEFNYRKLKSYKIQNVVDDNYGPFSEPTYQSELPVSIEKMVILREKNSPDRDIDITEQYSNGIETIEILRRNGIYYNPLKHKKFGTNKYNIPLGETIAIFGENSVQDAIKIQVAAELNTKYNYTIYLIDVYENISNPTSFSVTT